MRQSTSITGCVHWLVCRSVDRTRIRSEILTAHLFGLPSLFFSLFSLSGWCEIRRNDYFRAPLSLPIGMTAPSHPNHSSCPPIPLSLPSCIMLLLIRMRFHIGNKIVILHKSISLSPRKKVLCILNARSHIFWLDRDGPTDGPMDGPMGCANMQNIHLWKHHSSFRSPFFQNPCFAPNLHVVVIMVLPYNHFLG